MPTKTTRAFSGQKDFSIPGYCTVSGVKVNGVTRTFTGNFRDVSITPPCAQGDTVELTYESFRQPDSEGIAPFQIYVPIRTDGTGTVVTPPVTPPITTPPAATVTNLSQGTEARVAILDFAYSPGDATYVGQMRTSSVDKTLPLPSVSMPANATSYIAFKHAATDANSPPVLVDFVNGAPTITAEESFNSTNGTDGDWTDVTDGNLRLFRPSPTQDNGFGARGGRYFFPTVAKGARWTRFKYVNGASACTPRCCMSSGQWLWVVGMSIIRNWFSGSNYTALRNAIMAQNPGSDPFMFVSARGGANQQAILDEQVTPILADAQLLRFVKAIYANFWINDLAFAGTRPYSDMSQTIRDGIGGRSRSILTKLKSLGLAMGVSDATYGNYAAAVPAVNGDLMSAGGNHPWIKNVLGPVHQEVAPETFDAAYGWPWVSQHAAMAQTYDTNLADEVHPNTAGYTAMRTNENASWKLIWGQTPASNTMQKIITDLGSSTTIAKKTRALAVFDMLADAYPNATQAQNSNRATLRAQLAGLAAA